MTIQLGSGRCACGSVTHAPKLVAVTGGPGAGKTAVLELALRAFCNHVAVLPESASIIFGGGFPRYPSDVGRRAAQRAIFRVQQQLEVLALGDGPIAVALCDRGTVDGVAYWPGDPAEYWAELGTTREAEVARYAAVIHLRTPTEEQGYNRDYALRVESAEEAHVLDQRISKAWDGHPRRIIVDSDADFVVKATRAIEHVRAQLPECCHLATAAE